MANLRGFPISQITYKWSIIAPYRRRGERKDSTVAHGIEEMRGDALVDNW